MEQNVDKRASPRVHMKVPLMVEGRDVNGEPVREETHTILTNLAGALVPLAADFPLNTRLTITNLITNARSECRVAWRSAETLRGRWSYGLALLETAGTFFKLTKYS
jgi:hypothetical protein